jgi:glycosyltransferase involved in cell wall biosynthesis
MPGDRPVVVAFINHWANSLGGAEHSLEDIVTFIAPRCRAHLITSEPGKLVEKAMALGVSCHVVPCRLNANGKNRDRLLAAMLVSWRGLVSFLWFVVRVSFVVRRISPDCIHANVPKSHVTLFLIAAMGFRGVCLFHMREIFKKGSAPYRVYQLLFPRKTGACIAISQTVMMHMPPGMKKESMVIYNGVAIPSVIHAREGHEEVRFVYLGRIVPWKGCHLLIGMFAQAKKRYPGANLRLTLVGDTLYWSRDYREQLLQQIDRCGLTLSCSLLPHTDDPYNELCRHQVFCNASYNEPFGRSIAEAQAVGLPVVAFDSGAVKEIVEHERTGLLVPYNDADGYVSAMGRFIDNQELVRNMGMKGHLRAKEFFNRDIQAPLICEYILNA